MPGRPYLLERIAGGGFDVGGFAAFVALVVVVVLYGRMLWPTVQNALSLFGIGGPPSLYRVQELPVSTPVSPIEQVIVPVPEVRVNVQPAEPVVVEKVVEVEKPVVSIKLPDIQEFLYSYYDPRLGGVNCADWDEQAGECRAVMATGLDWREWYGRAVACSSEIPLYSRIIVVEPREVAGEYYCLDRGGLIEGTSYLDFLDSEQRLPWNAVVRAYVVPPE